MLVGAITFQVTSNFVFNPGEAYCTETHLRILAAKQAASQRDLRTQLSLSQHPCSCSILWAIQEGFSSIYIMYVIFHSHVTGSGIKVFVHDTLLTINRLRL